MKKLLDDNDFILTEAAIVERLRRDKSIRLDPSLVHAPLIYSDRGRAALSKIYAEYLDLAISNGLPILLGTPTWRTNRERVEAAGANEHINQDTVRYLRDLVKVSSHGSNVEVKIGGIIGCKNDCYTPEQALSAQESEEFHRWQVDLLAAEKIDFLMAVTLPEVQEALGLARAMASSDLPYIVSFVIGVDGALLDGTSLEEAIALIDSAVENPPLGYFVNCSYPGFFRMPDTVNSLSGRLLGFQANASSLSHSELEGASELMSEPISEWVSLMKRLNSEAGIKVLGGCCGTDSRHLEGLINELDIQ